MFKLKWKLLPVLFTLFLFNSAYAQSVKIDLSVKNESLRQFIKQIETKTDYTFMLDQTVDQSQKVTVDARQESLDAILKKALAGKQISYEIVGKQIILKLPGNTQSNQSKKISGTVKDQNGEPIIGANVSVKGTTVGAITDIDGNFSLDIEGKTTIQVTYVGYISQDILLENQSNIKIILLEDSQNLEEVVIVGYDTQKKVNLTGAVETVKSSKIVGKPVISLAEALTGEAAGLTVTQSSGQPKADRSSTIRVRGVGTWGNANPLVLVDGISMSMDNVVASDVESVTVLKDAASAAIYGSRAANGVILITTKKGNKDKISLSYTGNVGFQTPTRLPKMVDSWEYAELYNQSMENEGRSSSLFPQDRIERMKAGGDPDKLEGNTDWYKELVRSAALQHSHNVTITGGGKNTAYMGSLGYSKQDGIIPTTAYERYNARLNTSTDITKWMKLGFNIAYMNGMEQESVSGAFSAFRKACLSMPYMPVEFSDGTWSYLSSTGNAVRAATEDMGMRKLYNNNVSVLITPELNPIEGLNVKGVFAYESNTYKQKQFDKTVEFSAFEPASQEAVIYVPRNQQTDTWKQYNNLTSSLTASYEKRLGKHFVKGLIGGSVESFKYSYTTASRKDFPNNDFSEIDAGDSNTASASGNSTYSSLASLFGRVNYSYLDRYLVEFNLRYDGSSKFMRGNRWGTFPSFSLGWRISEEEFFQKAKNVFSNLKIRGSWGILGNQQIDDYQYYSVFGGGGTYLFDNTINTGYKETAFGNTIITWEKSKNLNIGVDFTTLQGRLSGTFDWYKRATDDILLTLKVPYALGIGAPMQNAGSVENKGWDLSLTWRDKIGEDFTYNVGFNLSDVKNKITDLKGYKSPSSDLLVRIEGEPIDALYGWVSDGICMTEEKYEEVKDLMKTYDPNWQLGDIVIKDMNNDGKINSDDKRVIGNTIPRFTYGLNLGFEYKNFDFSCFFQGVGKADGYINENGLRPMGVHSARKEHYSESFNPKSSNPNMNAYYPNMYNSRTYNYAFMSHWVQNASYLRLKNLQIGYTFNFPKQGIEKLRLVLSAQNLFTLTKYRTFDPETNPDPNVWGQYPNVSVYSFGVNIVF